MNLPKQTGCNGALANNHFHRWREATTVICAKIGKPDYSVPKAYRPIALLNCLGKILEKLMATRLAYLSETHSLLHHDQDDGNGQQ